MPSHRRLLIPLSVLALLLPATAPAIRAQSQPSAARHIFVGMQRAMQKAPSAHIVYHTALVPLTPPYTGQKLLSGVADISQDRESRGCAGYRGAFSAATSVSVHSGARLSRHVRRGGEPGSPSSSGSDCWPTPIELSLVLLQGDERRAESMV
jgi:hypothetical protein